MTRRRLCHEYSPGRRFVDWLHRGILSVKPHDLLTPSETVLLGIGFCVFVVLFISILLPVYLGQGRSAAGYAGTIVPIIYMMFLGHYIGIRAYHRMASYSQFDTSLFHFERWSRQADSAWVKIGIAFREAKMRETMLGEAITQSDVSEKITEVLKTGEVTDLATKLRKAVQSSPRTYYEQKLLKFLFPLTREQRKQMNRKRIVFLPLIRMWVWRKTVVIVCFFLLSFVLPLGLFLPLSYKEGSAPNPNSQSSRRILQDAENSPQMYASSYYALYFFSLFLPFLYLVLLVSDMLWVLIQWVSSCCSRICKDRSDHHPKNAGSEGRSVSPPIGSKLNRPKRGMKDPRRKNLELAETDINDAFDTLRERSKFTWSSAASTKKMSSAQTSQRDLADRAIPLDVTFRALENFQSGHANPDVRVLRIRAAALAGRVFCIRRDLILEWKQHGESENGIEDFSDDDDQGSSRKFAPSQMLDSSQKKFDPMLSELQMLETALTRAISAYAELSRMFIVQRAQLMLRVLKRLRERYGSGSFRRPGIIEVSQVLNTLRELDSILLGVERRDPDQNEIQWTQDVRDLEERLEMYLIQLQIAFDEEHTKEAQFLCWTGLARTHAAVRGLEEGELVAEHLRKVLRDEVQRKNPSAKRLAENRYVKKCFFWLSFVKLVKSIGKERKQMENQAVQPRQREVGETVDSVGFDPMQVKQEVEEICDRLEREILELTFGPPDPTVQGKTPPVQVTDFLKQGLILPLANSAEEDDRDHYSRSGGSSPAPSSSPVRDNALLTHEELFQIETALADAYAVATLAQLLGLELLGPKRRSESMETIKLMLKRIERFFSAPVLKLERIRYVIGLAKLEEQLSAVNLEWQDLSSKKEKLQRVTAQSIQHRENCFRLGVSFEPEVPIKTSIGIRQLDDLRAKSFAGLVLMNVQQGKLEEAEGWTDRLRIKLPAYCLETVPVEMALYKYKRARLESQLGSIMFPLYNAFVCWNGKLSLHLSLFWVVFVLPLILGLNFVVNHPEIPENALTYDWFADSVFWLQFFGVLLPVFFVLASALRWTLERRLLWFGEREAEEELHQDISNTLVAVQIAHSMEQKRGQIYDGNVDDSKASGDDRIAPRFGGEYPYWTMGEHLITAPGKKAMQRHGHRLQVTRMALVLVFFGLCPIVALPPTIVIVTTNGILSRSSAYYYAMLVITISFPVITLLFFGYKLVVDALPSTLRHARSYYLWYMILFFIFPLVLGVPILTNGNNSPVASASLFTWVICSCLGCVFTVLRDLVRGREEVSVWLSMLTWEKRPIEKIGTFAFALASVFLFLSILGAFCVAVSDVFSPSMLTADAQSSMSFAIAALEVVACIACVVACTSGVKLGWIHPEMAASSLMPFSFVVLGGMVATTMAVKVVRHNGNPLNVTLDSSVMRPMAESACWGIALQIFLLGLYLAQFRKRWEQRTMFGYFPDDWELIAPTARFVVEEARDVAFESDQALRRDLLEHGVQIPYRTTVTGEGHTTVKSTIDRAKAEQALEETIRKEKEEAGLFELKVKKKRAMYQKHVKHRLAETVFAEIMRGVGDDSVGLELPKESEFVDGALSASNKIIRRYRIAKRSLSLNLVLTSPVEGKKLRLLRFHPTHFLDLLESTEFHIVNVLFKVIHAYRFDTIQEFRWVTADNAVANFSHFRHPEILVTLLEVRFRFKMLERIRLLVFERAEERDEFIRFAWKHTIGTYPTRWVYDGDRTVDSLRQVGATMSEDTNPESANV